MLTKKKVYKYNGKQYTYLWELKKAMPNVGIPISVTKEQLNNLGVAIEYIDIPISTLKQNKLIEINQWTKEKIVGGFDSSVSGELVRYDSDEDTQLTMQGIALNVNTPLFDEKYPNGCPIRGYRYKNINGEVVRESNKTIFMLSSEQVMRWQADLSIHIGECKKQGWRKQDEVNKCTTVDELNKVILE